MRERVNKYHLFFLIYSTDDLYFGDNAYGNNPILEYAGGAGGGALSIESTHIDIDGTISVDGLPPDSRFDAGSGE